MKTVSWHQFFIWEANFGVLSFVLRLRIEFGNLIQSELHNERSSESIGVVFGGYIGHRRAFGEFAGRCPSTERVRFQIKNSFRPLGLSKIFRGDSSFKPTNLHWPIDDGSLEELKNSSDSHLSSILTEALKRVLKFQNGNSNCQSSLLLDLQATANWSRVDNDN